MRELTIKREKSMIAWAAKDKVYIEDPIQGDLQIGGVACRKLGELKNGEEKTFQIDSHAVRIYVISDKLTKSYSNDFFPVPAGDEPVRLTGQHKYDLSAGHPFRFEGLTDPAALANRKKGGKKGTLVLFAAVIIGLIIGFGSVMLEDAFVSPKDFTVHNMTITLTNAFHEEEYDALNRCYASNDVAVLTLEEPFSLVDGIESYSLEQYGKLVIQANRLTDTQLKTENGVTYFTYTSNTSGTAYYYFATVHKGTNGFWLIQFVVEQDQAEQYQDDFFQWAASVRFGS